MHEELRKLGIKDLFDEESANLSGITGDDDFYVSQVYFIYCSLVVNVVGGEIPETLASYKYLHAS